MMLQNNGCRHALNGWMIVIQSFVGKTIRKINQNKDSHNKLLKNEQQKDLFRQIQNQIFPIVFYKFKKDLISFHGPQRQIISHFVEQINKLKEQMILKILLVVILIIKSKEIPSYRQAYRINTPISFTNTYEFQNDYIYCDNNFTKCVANGLLMMRNQTSNQFYVNWFNPACTWSQISKDGKVLLCRTASTATSSTYSVILNPELGFTSVQTISALSPKLIMSPDGQWLIDQKSINKQIELYKWNVGLRIYQSAQNISAQGNYNFSFYYRVFSTNSEYLITYEGSEIDLFVKQAGTFTYTSSLQPQPTMLSNLAFTIVPSQDQQTILFSSRQIAILLNYSRPDSTIKIYQSIIESGPGFKQMRTNRNLSTIVTTRFTDNNFDVYKIQNGQYVHKNIVKGVPNSPAIYLSYDANWIIMPMSNGITMVFYSICQIAGCIKCASPNVCSQCVSQSKLFLIQQSNRTSCQCNNDSYYMSQKIDQCVQCKVYNCLKCDQKGQCLSYQLNTLQIVLLVTVIVLIGIILCFIIIVFIKLNKLNTVHADSLSKVFPSKQEVNVTVLNVEDTNLKDLQQENPTKMNLENNQQNSKSNISLQMKQSLHVQPQSIDPFQNCKKQNQTEKRRKKRLKIQQIPDIDFVSIDGQLGT